MGRKSEADNGRARQVVAQEAARIIVEQGVQDYRLAKTKAAERLGMSDRGSLPRNDEIEKALAEHLLIFQPESHGDLLQSMRCAALSAMQMLEAFSPRLVGPVLAGTAGEHSAVNLHLFSDSPEQIAFHLHDSGINYKPFERRYKSRRGRAETYAAFAFTHANEPVEVTVFPYDGLRQAPISPVDGKPMRRADLAKVQEMMQIS